MSASLFFTKMQAVGNDFVVVEDESSAPNWHLLAQAVCHRHTGVGADGLLLVQSSPSNGADIRMRIFNADGSEDTMCGNGLRCVVRLAHLRGRVATRGVAETRSGNVPFTINEDQTVTLQLPPPKFAPEEIPIDRMQFRAKFRDQIQDGLNLQINLPGGSDRVDAVNTGSTHAVLWVNKWPDDAQFAQRLSWAQHSRWIEHIKLFPERTSVLWTVVEAPDRLRIRIWERGVGETMGCGTGAAAAAVLARVTGRSDREEITVISSGGALRVGWSGEKSDPIFLTGPAVTVFSGEWPGPAF